MKKKGKFLFCFLNVSLNILLRGSLLLERLMQSRSQRNNVVEAEERDATKQAMSIRAYNPSSLEAEAGGCEFLSQPSLCSEIQLKNEEEEWKPRQFSTSLSEDSTRGVLLDSIY